MRLPENALFERLEIRNSRGARVVGLLSTPRKALSSTVVVISPGYERQISNYSPLSVGLNRHGFTTLRFDLSNHVGQSDGEIADLTMTSIADDIEAVLGQLGRGKREAFLVAPSLSARAAVRVLSRGSGLVSGMVMLLPVVDVKYTVEMAAGVDGIELWRSGAVDNPSRVLRIVEHDVAFEFARDAVECDWCGAGATRDEIAVIDAPVTAISAEADEWVRDGDVEYALSGGSSHARKLVVLEATSHDVAHNPAVIRLLLEMTIRAIDETLGIGERQVHHLDFHELVSTIAVERRWARGGYAALPMAEFLRDGISPAAVLRAAEATRAR